MVEVDSTLFPIIVFTTLPVEISDKDIDEFLLFYENMLLESKEKVIIIHDINKSRFLSSDQMSRIAQWSKKNKPLFTEKTLGNCIVSSSILSNLIIKAIKLLLKSTFDSEIYSTMDAAMIWAKSKLPKK
jgi:hypothetical protein